MFARTFAIAALTGAAAAAPAHAAAPGMYDATLTVAFVGTAVVHTYDVDADCASGAYTGTGTTTADPNILSVSGTISATGVTGRSVYPSGVSMDFNLRPTKTDPTLRGSWKGNKLIGTVVSEKAIDC